MITCAKCGQENPAGFSFCGACGAPLAAAEPPPEEERKVITALFTDIVGSTASAEQLDPEDVRARLAPYYARLRQELESFGGTVEKFIGDAVVALFGAPVAHEDDPERAVRAGMAITKAVAELNAEDAWLDLHIRTAIHTGEALVVVGARAVEGEGLAAGDVMNTAARLQGGAPVDGIVVGEATRRATEHAIEYRDAEPVQAKGKAEPIPIWEVVGEKAAPERPRARTQLVGRSAELSRLTGLWDRVLAERRPHLVTVLGAPGIGKTRLLLALCEEVEQSGAVHWGRCLPYGEGITYWPVIEILKDAAGIRQSDDSEGVSAKLGGLLDGLPASDQDELRTMATALANLIGPPRTPRGTYSATEISQAELHWGIRRVLQLLAVKKPILVVFEDLHWAEPTLLDLVRYLHEDAEAPLLIVASARPELAETDAAIRVEGERRHLEELEALSEDESRSLLAGLLGAEAADERFAKVLETAAGNPLFLEETVEMLSGTGPDVESIPVPDSLQALIGSRLDTLAAREKRVAQHASIMGSVFWAGAVGHLQGANGEVGDSLATLERRDFVRANAESSIAGDREYAFKHILIRDVAYERLPKGRRAELHARFVSWLRELVSDDEFIEIEAYHLEQACLHARAVARAPIEPPINEAADALRRSAEKAANRQGMREADRFYARALDLAGDGDLPITMELRLARGGTLAAIGELERAVEQLQTVTDDAAELGRPDLYCSALVTLSNLDHRVGRPTAARQRLLEAAPLAAQIGDRRLQIRSGYGLSAVYADFEGEFELAAEKLEGALSVAEEIGDRGLCVEGHLRLGFLFFNLGELKRSEEELTRCIELAGELGSRRDETRAIYLLGLARYYRGELEEAERLALHAREWLERTGEPYFQIQNLVALAIYAFARDDLANAETWLREAIPLALEEGRRVIEVYRYLVEALVLQNRVEDATQLVEFAGRSLPEEDVYSVATFRLAEALAATGRGERDDAVARFEEALRVYQGLRRPIESGQTQVALARALQTFGELEEAREQFERARQTFRQIEAIGVVDEIERELAELPSGAGRTGPARAG